MLIVLLNFFLAKKVQKMPLEENILKLMYSKMMLLYFCLLYLYYKTDYLRSFIHIGSSKNIFSLLLEYLKRCY